MGAITGLYAKPGKSGQSVYTELTGLPLTEEAKKRLEGPHKSKRYGLVGDLLPVAAVGLTGYGALSGAGLIGGASGTAGTAGTATKAGTTLGTLKELAQVAGGAASVVGLLGGGEAVSQTPVPSVAAEPEPVMPTVDSAAVQRARRRRVMQQLARRGRESTILTDPLGG